MGSPTSRLLLDSNRIGVHFLLTQLRVGFTFIDMANQEKTPETRLRHLGRADSIYTLVRRMMARVEMLPSEQRSIEGSLTALGNALVGTGTSLVP